MVCSTQSEGSKTPFIFIFGEGCPLQDPEWGKDLFWRTVHVQYSSWNGYSGWSLHLPRQSPKRKTVYSNGGTAVLPTSFEKVMLVSPLFLIIYLLFPCTSSSSPPKLAAFHDVNTHTHSRQGKVGCSYIISLRSKQGERESCLPVLAF